jgi:hypothetical protein
MQPRQGWLILCFWWVRRNKEGRKNQNILNSKPEDFARSRAEVFPIANEAGGMMGVHLFYLKSGIHAAEAGCHGTLKTSPTSHCKERSLKLFLSKEEDLIGIPFRGSSCLELVFLLKIPVLDFPGKKI